MVREGEVCKMKKILIIELMGGRNVIPADYEKRSSSTPHLASYHPSLSGFNG